MRLSRAGLCALLSLSQLSEAANPRPYPPADGYLQTTNILNHTSYLDGLDDQQWYLDNIPFIDVPDKQIQDVYYYRTSVIKRHIKWTYGAAGWMVTEFIHPVSWASKFQTIPDSAGHHVVRLPTGITPLAPTWLPRGVSETYSLPFVPGETFADGAMCSASRSSSIGYVT